MADLTLHRAVMKHNSLTIAVRALQDIVQMEDHVCLHASQGYCGFCEALRIARDAVSEINRELSLFEGGS